MQIFSDYLSFERNSIEEKPWKLVKKAFMKKPFLNLLLTLVTGSYHFYNLWRRAVRSIENTKTARKVIFCIQAQQKIERIKSEESCHTRLLERAKKEKIGIHRLEEIYSHDEILRLMHHPVGTDTFLSSTYFIQKPSEAWQALHQKNPSPCDVDRINVYYEQLRQKNALSHEDVLELVDKKIQGRRN